MIGVSILGATGSIGVSTLDVLQRHPDRYHVVGLSANTEVERLAEQCRVHHPQYAVMADELAAQRLRERLRKIDSHIEVLAGTQGLETVAAHPQAGCVMAAIVGAAGLVPALAAVRAGKRILLANKEALVMSGQIFMDEVHLHKAELLPVDSEHNAILQCLPMVPDRLLQPTLAQDPAAGNDRVLILVQLTGGNDGLNTVVPYEDDVYARSRPTICLPTRDLHKIDDRLGFHPRMAAFSRLYKEGDLSIIQGVGCPNPSGDHAVAMRHWHQADTKARQTGWLGRLADQTRAARKTDVPVALVSTIHRPFVLTARQAIIPRIDTLDKVTLRQPMGTVPKTPRQANAFMNLLQENISFISYFPINKITNWLFAVNFKLKPRNFISAFCLV